MDRIYENELMNVNEASSAIAALHGIGERFELPETINMRPLDQEHELVWHDMALADRLPVSYTSLHFSGRSNGKGFREFDAEIRLYLKTFHWEQGQKRYEASLIAEVVTDEFKTISLFESHEQREDCPLVYGSTIDEVLKIAQQRMNSAIKRALHSNCIASI